MQVVLLRPALMWVQSPMFMPSLVPWVAAYALSGILRIGGIAYVQSHPSWPLRDEPWDFLRFFREGWNGLFNAWTGFEVVDTAWGTGPALCPLKPGEGLPWASTYSLPVF